MRTSRRLKTLFMGALLTLIALANGLLLIQGVGIRSTEKFYVAFVWHLHQPVLRNNLDSIDLCYEMIPKIYLNHTSVKATINLQGMLIDQLAEIRPSVLDLYRNLTDTGQIELLASGHYHPILPLLPDILREKQIAKQIATVEKYFNVTPKGIWFPECGFSMDLIPLLNNFSLKYGVIEQQGLTGVSFPEQIQPHNITYRGGFTVFPRDKDTSMTVAFGSTNPQQRAQDVINEIYERRNDLVSAGIPNPIIVVAGDGEVVGEHWYEGIQFLESLLTKLEQEQADGNIETVTLGEYYDTYGPYGTRDSVPPSTWAWPPDFDWWNGSIVDLHSQDRDNHAMNEIIEAEGLGENLTTAWEYLMKSEESGLRYKGFGDPGALETISGQRGMIYTHIIMAEGEAEQFTDGLNITEAPSRVKAYQKVVILENEFLKIYVAPYAGGRIIELDSKATNSNLVNTYQYSQKISRDYRNALTDGIYEISPTDLAFKRYDYEISSTADSVSLKLNYTILSGPYSGLQIQKTLTLRSNSPNLEIYFNLTNTAEEKLTFHFTSEWCLTPGGYLDGEDRMTFREGDDVWQTSGVEPEDVYGEFPWVEVEDQNVAHWWDGQPRNKQEYAAIFLDGQVNQIHAETPHDTYPGNVIKLIYKATTLRPGETNTITQNFTTGWGNHTVFDPTPVKKRGPLTQVELDGDLSDWSGLDYVSLYDLEDNTDAVTDILNVTITNDAYYLYIGLILRGNIEATLEEDNRFVGLLTNGGSIAKTLATLRRSFFPNATIGTDNLGFPARIYIGWWNGELQNLNKFIVSAGNWKHDMNYGQAGYTLVGARNNTMEIAIPLGDNGLMCESTDETLNLTIVSGFGVSQTEDWDDLDVVPEQPGNITYQLLPFVAGGMNVTPTTVDFSIKRGESNSTTIQIEETTGKADLNVTIAVKGEISTWLTTNVIQAIFRANTTLDVLAIVEVPINAEGGKYDGAIEVSEEGGTYIQIPSAIAVKPKLTVQTPYSTINVTIDGNNFKTDVNGKITTEVSYGSRIIEVQTPVGTGVGSRDVFTQWSDGVTSNPRNIAVIYDMNLTVYYNKTQYYLSVNSAFGSPTGEDWYESGTNATFSIEYMVDQGNGTRRIFTSWSGDSTSTNNTASIIMDVPHTVNANWKTQYWLQVNTNVPGLTISGSGWYDIGTNAITGTAPSTINITAGARYLFVAWAMDGVNQTDKSIDITMNASYTANAIYKTQYYLTVNSPYGDPQGEDWYDADSNATFSVTSPISAGLWSQYVFENWSGDSTASTPTTAILMDGPKNVTANWRSEYTRLFYIVIGGGAAVGVGLVIAIIFVLMRRKKP